MRATRQAHSRVALSPGCAVDYQMQWKHPLARRYKKTLPSEKKREETKHGEQARSCKRSYWVSTWDACKGGTVPTELLLDGLGIYGH